MAAMAAYPPSELPYLGTSGIILTSDSTQNNLDDSQDTSGKGIYSYLNISILTVQIDNKKKKSFLHMILMFYIQCVPKPIIAKGEP